MKRQLRALYLQYANPALYPPLEHSSRLLAERGWQALFLGIGAFGDADDIHFPAHRGIRVLRLPYCRPGWRQKLHYALFCMWAAVWFIRWRPDWVYASDLYACLPALALSFLGGSRVVYHEHDSRGVAPDGAFNRLHMAARRRLARRAVCALPSLARAHQFRDELGAGDVRYLPNYPLLEEIRPERSAAEDGRLRVYYHGTVVPPRVPRTVIEALAALPVSVSLMIVGFQTVGHQSYVSELKDFARMLGVEDRLQIQSALPRRETLAVSATHDVGLSLMPITSPDVNMRHMVGASNKVTDYLANGLALLVSDLDSWRAMFVETGYGLACDPEDPTSIAAALRWFLEHPREMRAMGERGRQRVLAEWHYEREFESLVTTMEQLRLRPAARAVQT